MRAVRFHRHGGPDVLQLDEVAVPEPAAGQVLIQAEAIGANAIDTVLRRGNSPWDRPLPGTLTGDVVGRVVKLGPGTPPALLGQRVSALSGGGFGDGYLVELEDVGTAVAVEAHCAHGGYSIIVGVINNGRFPR